MHKKIISYVFLHFMQSLYSDAPSLYRCNTLFPHHIILADILPMSPGTAMAQSALLFTYCTLGNKDDVGIGLYTDLYIPFNTLFFLIFLLLNIASYFPKSKLGHFSSRYISNFILAYVIIEAVLGPIVALITEKSITNSRQAVAIKTISLLSYFIPKFIPHHATIIIGSLAMLAQIVVALDQEQKQTLILAGIILPCLIFRKLLSTIIERVKFWVLCSIIRLIFAALILIVMRKLSHHIDAQHQDFVSIIEVPLVLSPFFEYDYILITAFRLLTLCYKKDTEEITIDNRR